MTITSNDFEIQSTVLRGSLAAKRHAFWVQKATGKLFSTLTIAFRDDDSFLHNYKWETGHIPWVMYFKGSKLLIFL